VVPKVIEQFTTETTYV